MGHSALGAAFVTMRPGILKMAPGSVTMPAAFVTMRPGFVKMRPGI